MKASHAKCATHDLWAGLTKEIANYLTNKTLTDVCAYE
jgi:DNA-binding IscR family transcriptional regulator